MSQDFQQLILHDLIQETKDSLSLVFEVPGELKDIFRYKAGQYLTLKFEIDGKEYRRPYSICTAPYENILAVNVKRIQNGRVSGYIHQNLSKGMRLFVHPPEGRFVLIPEGSKRRQHFFIAAGSGITPVISMIKDILENEAQSVCHLLYGNRSEDSIIFYGLLKDLENRYSGQFSVTHTLSKPEIISEGGLKGLFGKKKTNWPGWTGRISKEKIEKFIKPDELGSNALFYICGPGEMIDEITSSLMSFGINESYIKTERFLAAKDPGQDDPEVSSDLGASVKVQLHGKELDILVAPGQTILDALIRQKYDPPYSCTSGACSTCVAKVLSGKVKMDVCYALDDNEVRAGYVLTCQAKVLTKTVELRYEN